MFSHNNNPLEHKIIRFITDTNSTYFGRPNPVMVEWSEIKAVKSHQTVTGIIQGSSEKELRAIACMCGMMIGDAFGAPIEFSQLTYNNPDPIVNITNTEHFDLKAGQFTDDTSMGLCLADSLIVNKKLDPIDLALRFVAWWWLGYNNAFKYDKNRENRSSVGLGGNISQSLNNFVKYGEPYTKSGDLNTSGNGSIMRNAPVPIMYWNNIKEGLLVAEKQSKVTHQGTVAAECAMLLTYICSIWINDNMVPLDGIIKMFQTNDETMLKIKNSEHPFDWKNVNFRFDEKRSSDQPRYIGSFSADCLAIALHCVNSTNNFKDAIIKCCNHGGDADSTGSVTGQLAGSLYGYNNIPTAWLTTCYKWHKGEIIVRAHKLFHALEK